MMLYWNIDCQIFRKFSYNIVKIEMHFANVEKRFVDVDWHFVNIEIGKISGCGGNGYLTCRNEGRFCNEVHFGRLNDRINGGEFIWRMKKCHKGAKTQRYTKGMAYCEFY